MKKIITALLCLGICYFGYAQETIELPHQKPEGLSWEGGEKAYFSQLWQNPVVTNVSVPTLQIFKPEAGKANGTSVIVAPGGGLFALSIESEGTDVAKWLNSKGITAFVLKYRLVPTGEDGVKEITDLGANNPQEIGVRVTPVLPLAIGDGLAAISYVRSQADALGLDKNKIGFMGFSAGGAVTMGVCMNYSEENRPDFLVPVYPWMTVVGPYEAPKDAPPMLVICATDDPLGLAADSTALYDSWLKAGKSVGLHMYSKGGHGFGMKPQGLPSDQWIARFHDWAVSEGLAEAAK
ncbi:alpha/beta hydrolase [Poritiphilus flavus]|uniref:Alpha/beta hydrolase fold domain-containing protein n=1 Tax=Poritiphilus flavus TaxID=2697053 RepID=A0A6L9E989_9FLAO|nr:alpha/beta hydrolase [Poritiphilus flavus]NAS11286.1 alpha/beta hydrolase fold domain-containing protein [Poritiphilus flavus]